MMTALLKTIPLHLIIHKLSINNPVYSVSSWLSKRLHNAGQKNIRATIQSCIVCRRYDSKRLEVAPLLLPVDRVPDAFILK